MPEALAPWTEQRVQTAVHLWNTTAASASDIAAELGGTSRRAVLGKLYRLGQLGKRRPAPHQRLQFGKPRPKAKTSSGEIAGVVSAYLTATFFGVEGTLTLGAGQCRWPFGDPKRGVAYCGRHADGSYCDHHHRRAHR